MRKVHHKTAVIDGRKVVAGSFNYMRPANDYNDENLFVVGSAYDEIKEPGKKAIKVVAAGRKELRSTFKLSSSASSTSRRNSRPARPSRPGSLISLRRMPIARVPSCVPKTR